MDKTKFKVVDYILGKDKPEVINIRIYLKHFSNRINPITKSELINYLEDKGYILLSPDYMMKKNKFINYCKDKNLYNISQIKKCILSDKCIPMITIKQEELNEILGLKEDRLKEPPDTYKIENNKIEEKYILAYHLNEPYIIKNLEELIEFGLKNTFVSYELIDEFNALNNDTGSAKVTHRISNHGINLSSKPIRLEIIKEKKDIYLEEEKEVKVAEKKEDNYIKKKNKTNKPSRNKNGRYNLNLKKAKLEGKTIIINLRLNEVLATFINIGLLGKVIKKEDINEYFLRKHISEFEKLNVLTRVEGSPFKSDYVVSEIGQKISKELVKHINLRPHRDLFMNSQITSEVNMERLFNVIKEDLRKLVLEVYSFKLQMTLIRQANKEGYYNILDIMRYCIFNNLEELFIWLFIGEKASGGLKAIRTSKDICLQSSSGKDLANNIRCRRCINNYAQEKITIEKLLEIRLDKSEKILIRILKNPKEIKLLYKEPILLKFLIRFGVTFYNKNLLYSAGLLTTKGERKSTGAYCPLLDDWRLTGEI